MAIHGKEFNPDITLMALKFYGDLDKPLGDDHKALLDDAVRSVDVQMLRAAPVLGPISRGSVLDYEPDRGFER